MKTIVIVSCLFFSFSGFSTEEHIPGQEGHVSEERLSKSRGCFAELSLLGCAHPREGQEIFNNCLNDNKAMLSQGCQKFFEKLYGKKSSPKS